MDFITKNKSNHGELSNSALKKSNDVVEKNSDLPSEEESDFEIESDSEILKEKKPTDLKSVSLFFKFFMYE